MAWSYRQDRTDELYANEPGVHQVSGKKLPHTPSDTGHAEEMLKPAKAVKGTVTQHQELPGQNVPRVIEGEGDTKKDKEIVEGVKANEKAAAPVKAVHPATDVPFKKAAKK